MKRIAIIGGGIAGVSAAYELARQRQLGASVDFTVFEASDRLGGIVETKCHDGFIIECGPDSWVSEKPWARELAIELGLESELIFSRDEHRRTYLAQDGRLHAMPDGMRMMVPVEWPSLLNSPLFSEQAKLEYQREPQRAEYLKAAALDVTRPFGDESVRDFVIRHFGAEVADTIAAPLLAGVFGGDIATLSARAVLPAYVALEREYGSLIAGLPLRRQTAASILPIFTSLRRGLSSLIQVMESSIPAESIRCRFAVDAMERVDGFWRVNEAFGGTGEGRFDAVLITTPAKTTARLLAPLDPRMAELLPGNSSSAIVVAFAFSAEQARLLRIPRGFGFLVPQHSGAESELHGRLDLQATARRALLACTFADQKFPHRAPQGAVLLRAFFGGSLVPALFKQSDAALHKLTRRALEDILGELPEPVVAVVRRWPDSLPLYTVGHLSRIAELEACAARFPHLRLIGNAYRGVGLPDLIREARSAARKMIAELTA